MPNVTMLSNPFEYLGKAKPDYLPLSIWDRVQHDLKSGRVWFFKRYENLLFSQDSQALFKLLGRKPNKNEVAQGARVWTGDDYVSWLETHNRIYAYYIDRDPYGTYHDIKRKLSDTVDQASQLIATLRDLYAMHGALERGANVLPVELKNLAFAYRAAVSVNNDSGGNAKRFEALAGLEEDSTEARALEEEISMHGVRGHLPTLADMLEGVTTRIRWHQDRFERDGKHGFSIGNYTPDSLLARYVALFDAGIEESPFVKIAQIPRVSHQAMSLQCGLVFPDEDVTKDRINDIRKRIKKANSK
ncbi:hypothetical protein [Crenobacter cavernae]|uniref:Uncharacterized protein n=1 Tax=Crenobacter cavernae TaxID=2290923 RepID=A0A345Y9U1_9NEIS|nr:hypothetical protein [Crenobacter cavernae]AXK40693.1 hypothetical protein DWG20_15380 [Crenobacter cavernae]